MNEKGWCSALGGSLAVVRTAAATSGEFYERICWTFFSFVFLPRFLARSYISRCGFEIIFMSRRQRPSRSTVCIYMRAYIGNRRRATMHPARTLLNRAVSRISGCDVSFDGPLSTLRDALCAIICINSRTV